MLIYKIFRADEWAALVRDGETSGAPIDVADGYVHFSTAQQVQETAAKHFSGEQGLLLLACDSAAMEEARAHDSILTKPPGALGRLEELAIWYRGWRSGARAEIAAPQIIVFAGNHGVAARGVSAFPAEVTAQSSSSAKAEANKNKVYSFLFNW